MSDPTLPPIPRFADTRRIAIGLASSLVVHVMVVFSAVGIAAWRGRSLVPPVRLAPIAFDVKELPLGGGRAAEPKADGDEPTHPVRRRKPARVRPSPAGAVVVLAPDGGVADASAEAGPSAVDGGREAGAGKRRPGDLRNYGPEGSRLTALLRLDRLRASPLGASYAAAIDQLLVLLPDRRRLLDGTGLDLYRDFDALLIASPEPRNDKVTFLAARHRLKDAALQTALNRGAAASGHAIEWRAEDGRPVGVRRVRPSAPGQTTAFNLDDRILVLPQPGLAVMAPPAYAEQLLGHPLGKAAGAEAKGDAGAGDARADASLTRPDKSHTRISWRDLIARIDAEDSALPEDTAFMVTAVNLFVLPGPSPVVPGTRGAVDEDVRTAGPYGPTPQALTLVAGVDPEPYLELVGVFENETDARGVERDFPGWKRRLMMNPMVLLSGFSPLIDRAELSREESTLFLRASTTAAELQRLLAVATNVARGLVGRPR